MKEKQFSEIYYFMFSEYKLLFQVIKNNIYLLSHSKSVFSESAQYYKTLSLDFGQITISKAESFVHSWTSETQVSKEVKKEKDASALLPRSRLSKMSG